MSDGLEWFTVGILGGWAGSPQKFTPHDRDKKAQIRNAALVAAVNRKLVGWDANDRALARVLLSHLLNRGMSEHRDYPRTHV